MMVARLVTGGHKLSDISGYTLRQVYSLDAIHNENLKHTMVNNLVGARVAQNAEAEDFTKFLQTINTT